ncbi:protein of unknown function [Methylorubrum extorquens]|uniref:Uncharacterized protein n=1 Tax=Methylorubrum extorquens TaxID=408 RepID=A0A2N9ARZ5_METEX|nr:protein of unknown function [Methylorubrum extorquens]
MPSAIPVMPPSPRRRWPVSPSPIRWCAVPPSGPAAGCCPKSGCTNSSMPMDTGETEAHVREEWREAAALPMEADGLRET